MRPACRSAPSPASRPATRWCPRAAARPSRPAPVCSAACSTASAGRSTARPPRRRRAGRPRRRRPQPAAPPPRRHRAPARRARARRARSARPRPAGRHLRRLRRRQVDAALDGRPRHRGPGLASSPSSASAAARSASSSRTTSAPRACARAVVVVATSRRPAACVRLRAAFVATRIAEWFRDRGGDVAADRWTASPGSRMAQREVGLSAGRAAGDARLPAERLRHAAPAARARRAGRDRQHHRRSTPCSSRATTCRTRSATPPARILDGHVVLDRAPRHRRALPEHRRARVGLPRRPRGHHPAQQRAAATAAAPAAGRATATSASSSRSGPTRTAATPTPTARSPCCPEIEAFLRQAPGELAGIDDTWARLAAIVPADLVRPDPAGADPVAADLVAAGLAGAG